MLLLLHHPFLFKENQRKLKTSQEGFLAPLPGRSSLKSRHTKYPSQTHLPCITLFTIFLSFSSPPLHPYHFIRPLFPNLLSLSLAFLFACVLDYLSLWRKIIPNCVISPIPIIMISLALQLLLLMMFNLVKSILLC